MKNAKDPESIDLFPGSRRVGVAKPSNAPRFPNLEAVKEANKRYRPPVYWFGTREMRSFGTKIASKLLGGKYFVTSEWANSSKTLRAYSIREALPDGSIDTVGKFLGYPTQKAAVSAVKYLLAKEWFEK